MLRPGRVALFGSGETSQLGGQIFEYLARQLASPLRVSLLETPAGFELNSAQVIGRVGDFLKVRLQNYRPEVTLVPARKKNTAFSPDNPEVVLPLQHSEMIFLGPGSPTYAVRQLKDSLAWQILQGRQRLGTCVVMASAAVVAAGALALPVYEIFKVGEDPHWKQGLDFFAPYGLSLVFVPHWNNAEGGSDLDTSHCFIGAGRYELLRGQLPGGMTLVGIDEHTGLIFDFEAGMCHVMGRDQVHLYCDSSECTFEKGDSFPILQLGDYNIPEQGEGIPAALWARLVWDADEEQEKSMTTIPPEVQALADERQQARVRKEWTEADRLRQEIARAGWLVQDTPEGPRLEPVR